MIKLKEKRTLESYSKGDLDEELIANSGLIKNTTNLDLSNLSQEAVETLHLVGKYNDISFVEAICHALEEFTKTKRRIYPVWFDGKYTNIYNKKPLKIIKNTNNKKLW